MARRRKVQSFIRPVPGPFVAIDFETADYSRDSACAIGLVRVERGRVVRRVRQLLCPPGERMLFTWLHGISLEDVRNKPSFADAWPVLMSVLEGARFLAAHNAGFDRGVLNACCESAGYEPPDLPWVCTVQVARQELGIKPANLANVAKFLKLPLNHHEALSDAEACARIVMVARQWAKK